LADAPIRDRMGTGDQAGNSGSVCARRSAYLQVEVVRSVGLEPCSIPKDHEVPGGSEGIMCPRRSAQSHVRLPVQGAWSLDVYKVPGGLDESVCP